VPPVRVAELWRYPVKSFAGERLDGVTVDGRGVDGDRLWALVDPVGAIASGKTTRRFRKVAGLLRHRSTLDGGAPVITLADGRSARAGTPELDALVAEIAPAGWALRREAAVPHFDAAPIHVVTSRTLATLGAAVGERVPVERLRPNVLLDVDDAAPFPEDAWLGRTLHIGGVELRIAERCERCVMVTQAQAQIPRRPRLLQTIGRVNRACAGVYAEVVAPGEMREGDAVRLV
jgi:uncharacterized protein YcbX